MLFLWSVVCLDDDVCKNRKRAVERLAGINKAPTQTREDQRESGRTWLCASGSRGADALELHGADTAQPQQNFHNGVSLKKGPSASMGKFPFQRDES